jgi:hypothetical protein
MEGMILAELILGLVVLGFLAQSTRKVPVPVPIRRKRARGPSVR